MVRRKKYGSRVTGTLRIEAITTEPVSTERLVLALLDIVDSLPCKDLERIDLNVARESLISVLLSRLIKT
jgi:hypothetical protein